jgi:hypothetical protein
MERFPGGIAGQTQQKEGERNFQFKKRKFHAC